MSLIIDIVTLFANNFNAENIVDLLDVWLLIMNQLDHGMFVKLDVQKRANFMLKRPVW